MQRLRWIVAIVGLLLLHFLFEESHGDEVQWQLGSPLATVAYESPVELRSDIELAAAAMTPDGKTVFSSVYYQAVQPELPDIPRDVAGDDRVQSLVEQMQQTESPEADDAAGDEVAGDDAASGELDDESLGEAPEDNSLLFLQRATPLLEPGAVSIDYGFRYTWREFQGLSLLPDGSLTTGRVRTRQLTSPFAIRYGRSRRTQLFANLPVGLGILDRADISRQEATSVYGIGDLTFGLSYLLRDGNAQCPSIIAGYTVTAPTGASPFENSPGPAALGSGFWGMGANIFMVQQLDPAVLFGGFGYSHQFDRSYLGVDFDPGESAFYSMGAGFAVNSDVTFTTTFSGSFQSKLRANRRSIPNSAAESMSLRFALVLSGCKHRILEPFVNLGLTPDAPNVDFGFIVTRR